MKIKIFLISILLLLSTCTSAYSLIRIGTFGDSITMGTGFKLTISEVEYERLGGYRYFLLDYFEGDGFNVDMVGLWGKEQGYAEYWEIGEEALRWDNNYMLKDVMDMDHTGWGGASAGPLVDYFILSDGAEQLFPKDNQTGPGSSMIIHIGTNNINNYSVEITELARLIDYMYAHDPAVNLIICQIIPRTDDSVLNGLIDAYNAALNDLVNDLSLTQDNLFLVDLNTPLRENWELLYADSKHPNNQGYSIMAYTLYMAMLHNDIIPLPCGSSCGDMDNDTVNDPSDNCPTISNFDQQDVDYDTFGDVCDNCEDIFNPEQKDADTDGTGDICDANTVYGSISGAVTEGIFVRIYKSSCGGNLLAASTLTDSEGYYSFGGLENGQYVIIPEISSYFVNSVHGYSTDIPQAEIQSYDFTVSEYTCNDVDRFLDNHDGTVTDCRTNIVWLKDANCDGEGSWDNAMAFASGLNSGECGLTDGSVEGDWRLPDKEELQGLGTDPLTSWYDGAPPVIFETPFEFFNIISSPYWSRTEADAANAFFVLMNTLVDPIPLPEGLTQIYSKAETDSRAWPIRDFATCDDVDRFLDNNDGTVTDCRTNIVWLKDANCDGEGSWDNAMAFASGLNSGECGLTDGSVEGDWRLPDKEELQGIGTDPPTSWYDGAPPVTFQTPFDFFNISISGPYWSRTEADAANAFMVLMEVDPIPPPEGMTIIYSKSETDSIAWLVRDDN